MSSPALWWLRITLLTTTQSNHYFGPFGTEQAAWESYPQQIELIRGQRQQPPTDHLEAEPIVTVQRCHHIALTVWDD